jgi:cell division protein FtsB
MDTKLTQHLSDEEINGYRQHKLSGQQLLKADLHITNCEDCRNRLHELSAVSTSSFVRNLREEFRQSARLEEDHIPYEQLESLVDAKLDPVNLEIVQSHLEVCGQCRNEADELRNFREKLDQPSDHVIPFRRRTIFNVALKVAAVAAMVALFAWIATLPLRNQEKQLRAQLEEAQKEIAELKNRNSDLQRNANQLQAELTAIKQSQHGVPVVASINDGGKVVSLDQKGNIAGIATNSPLYKKMAEDALTKQTIETPVLLAKLIGKQGSLLGNTKDGHPFDLIAPVGTVISQDRPNFQWKPLKGATGYRVHVYDRDFKEVASSDLLKETKWTPSNQLQRGGTYNWIVTAQLPDKEVSSPTPPAPEAKFLVLDSVQSAQLTQARQDLAKSHLLLGLTYAKLGLLDDSIGEFEQLLIENPDSPIAQKLLERVKSLREK